MTAQQLKGSACCWSARHWPRHASGADISYSFILGLFAEHCSTLCAATCEKAPLPVSVTNSDQQPQSTPVYLQKEGLPAAAMCTAAQLLQDSRDYLVVLKAVQSTRNFYINCLAGWYLTTQHFAPGTPYSHSTCLRRVLRINMQPSSTQY